MIILRGGGGIGGKRSTIIDRGGTGVGGSFLMTV